MCTLNLPFSACWLRSSVVSVFTMIIWRAFNQSQCEYKQTNTLIKQNFFSYEDSVPCP